VGDTVYLDDTPFEITNIGSFDIQLRDSRNGFITEYLAADLKHTDTDLREALISGLLEKKDKENIAGSFRENEGNTRVAQRPYSTYAGISESMELITGATADIFATTTGLEVDIHDKYGSKRTASWEEITPILRALYQQEQDGFSHEPVLREPAALKDVPSAEAKAPEPVAKPSEKPRPESGVSFPGEIITETEHIMKNAEMAMEDDYGMLDGIINNGPKATVAELEQQAKTGQPISLLELAEAARRERDEKKKSVVQQLRNQPVNREHKKTAPKKSAEMER
jgi:hypothetical protein